MKRKLITLFIALGTVFSLYAQEDSLRATRYVMRSTMVGVGHSNVFETYLSPLEYSGTEVRFMHESGITCRRFRNTNFRRIAV